MYKDTHVLDEIFDPPPHAVLALDGGQISVYLLVRGASHVGDQVLQVVGRLQLDLAVEFGHDVYAPW